MPPINKHKPQTAKARSWDDIEYHFDTWFEEQYKDNIAELVRHIKGSGISARLFGFTSMDKLIISIYDPIEWDREALHVEFDTKETKWKFRYYPLPLHTPEFVRQYPKENGIEKFDNFVKMIGW